VSAPGPFSIQHIFGSTACPTPFAPIQITNMTDAPISLTVTKLTVGTNPELITVASVPATLPPGASTTLNVAFNCGEAEDVTGVQVRIRAMQGSVTEDIILTYNVDVIFP
jgi:hypothetical protein